MAAALQPTRATTRFFALTHERLALVAQHSLSASEISCWAAIELTSAPNIPRRYTIQEVAELAHVALPTAKKAIARLAEVGVIWKQRRSHGLWICPSTQPFSPSDGPDASRHDESNRIPDKSPKPANTPKTANDKETSKLKESRKAFEPVVETEPTQALTGDDQAEVIQQLEADCGIWQAQGKKLCRQHSTAKVKELMMAVLELKKQGRIENAGGYLQKALKHDWAIIIDGKPPIDNYTDQEIRDLAIAAIMAKQAGKELTERQIAIVKKYQSGSVSRS